jgi:hypothetical protein
MTVAGDVATTKGIVIDQVASANSRTDGTIAKTYDAINNLANVASFVPDQIAFVAPSINVNIPLVSGIAPGKPSAAIAAIKAAIGATPGNFSASIAERAMQDAPQEQFSAPTINLPTAPTFAPLVKPSSLVITMPDDIPDTPVVNLPSDLTVGDQTVPNIPSISLPTWGEVIPTMDIDLPSTTLAYVEPVYTSTLKTAIASKLLDGVNSGGTGLGTTVSTNIWNADVERLEQQKDDDIDKVMNLYAGRGFDLPTGMMAMQVQEILKNYTNDRAQNSRTISIEEAKLAKEMTQFFLSTGLSLEQIEIAHANNVANRALDAQKAVVQFSIDLFNSKVVKYNLELEKYKAKAIESEMLLKIQELVLSQYKAELEGVDVKLKQDAIKIENYNALLASHDINIKLYQSQVAAVLAQLSIEKGKVDVFRGEIDAYVAEIGAQKSQYDLYLAEIEGETARIDIYSKEVDAYATRVNAVKVSNDVVVERVKADVSIEEMNLRSHLANIELYKAKSDQAISEIGQEADLYRTESAVFQTLLSHAQSQSEMNIQTQIRTQSLIQVNAEMSLEAAKANLSALLEANRIRVQAASSQSEASSAMAGMIGGAIQGMLQLGGQGTSNEYVDTTP